jgi:hypothetical protein
LLRKLEWVKNYTTEKLRTNYFLIVNTLARNMHHNLDYPVEVEVSRGRTLEMSVGEMLAEIEEAHIRINEIVRDIAKKYSLDIPFKTAGWSSEVPDMESLMKKKE